MHGSSPCMTKRSTVGLAVILRRLRSAHIPTAIDVKFLTGDETALRSKQIKHGVRDVSDIGTERQRLSFDHSPIEGRAVALIVLALEFRRNCAPGVTALTRIL